jgi:hypothetical protein
LACITSPTMSSGPCLRTRRRTCSASHWSASMGMASYWPTDRRSMTVWLSSAGINGLILVWVSQSAQNRTE